MQTRRGKKERKGQKMGQSRRVTTKQTGRPRIHPWTSLDRLLGEEKKTVKDKKRRHAFEKKRKILV